jgi:hypothetical protein
MVRSSSRRERDRSERSEGSDGVFVRSSSAVRRRRRLFRPARSVRNLPHAIRRENKPTGASARLANSFENSAQFASPSLGTSPSPNKPTSHPNRFSNLVRSLTSGLSNARNGETNVGTTGGLSTAICEGSKGQLPARESKANTRGPTSFDPQHIALTPLVSNHLASTYCPPSPVRLSSAQVPSSLTASLSATHHTRVHSSSS